ncbi:MAG: TonB-dependent receptor [Ferruginibacter sp.]|nr:TonB-dependent receptor [Ferruginibacter sp.]
MMYKKTIQTFLLLFVFSISVAQTRKLVGKVTNEDGGFLQGVNVNLKNSNTTTQTDALGIFSINISDKGNSVLVFSYIGYAKKEVLVKTQLQLSVAMEILAKDGEEVIVVGYGTQKKKDLTGSVAKVNIAELQKAPVRSFEEALGGRVAGVQVTSTDGQPGSPIAIVIRGNNSVTQDNSPLYVVDGFPLENPNNNAINPSDIESIEVLKDASASAIYGARAANGVILITTKKGKAGKTEFNFNSFYGTQNIINKIDVLSPYEFLRYNFELDSTTIKSQYYINGKDLKSYEGAKGIDWQNQVFRQAPIYSNSLSMSGGSAATKFFISLSALTQDGIVKYSGYDRYQGRLKLDHNVNSKFKVGINLNYSALKAKGTVPSSLTNSSSQSSNLMFSVWGYRPILGNSAIDLLESNDPFFEGDPNDSRFNPLETVKYELRNRSSNTLYGNTTLEYEIIKNLKFKALIGYTNDVDRNEEFNNTKTSAGSPYSVGGRANGVNGSYLYNTTNSYVSENTLSYNKKFDKNHKIDAVAGFTFQGVNRYIYGAAASKLPNERLGLSGLDEGIPTRVPSSKTYNRLASFLGRVNYNYGNRYLATVSFRSDGSSKFTPSNKWSYFPSGSLAWRLSQENFMKKVKFISDAKLRMSYGLVGNNRVSDFAPLSTLNSPITQGYPFNNTLTSSTVPFSLGNPNLRWETTAQADAGIDISFFNEKLSVGVDVYRKVTRDLLLNADLPPSSGFSSAFKNIGKIENKGLEITVNGKIFDKSKFSWNAGFNVSFNRNKILELNEGQSNVLSTINWDNQWRGLPAYIARVGQPLGQFFGYVWDGLYQISDFNVSSTGAYTLKSNITSNTSTASARIQPGHIKYKDLNGDLVMNDNDRTVIGNANPDFTGGFTNNFTYKNFDLNVFFQFSYGGELLNANRYVFEGNSGRTLQNHYTTVLNRWTVDNQNNEMFVARGNGDKVYSSRVLEDGSYLRLKTVQLGYTLSTSLMKKVKVKSLRFYLSAQNLLTWTSYTGFDPEVSSYNSALTPGFDYSVYPRARTMTIGLNLNF